ncbi:hypothetical protein PF010_g25056 [Phytophthora fragariae]|uniref:DDE-1 domain-containing protein n=2 Tax=Phytophthora fragariae TaxID=53985 RepID=A0A6G0K1G8_9STRA|nr:hypothetical protein PF010_g25056 [Phytophthora fragariae]
MSSVQTAVPDVSKAELYLAAVCAVEDGMSIRKAAKKYGLQRESLRCRVRGYVPVNCRRGPQLVYINAGADEGLLEAVFYRAAHGLSIGTTMFRDLVRQAALATSIKEVLDDFPNIKWIQRWMQKHSNVLSYRKGRILDAKRAECSTTDTVRYYYNNLEKALTTLGLKDKPAQIWNCDETGVTAQGNCNERVICPKGMSASVQRSSDRENVSIMGCVNAEGGFIPPLYIYAGARRKVSWLEKAPVNSKCAVTGSSNINRGIFLQWFKWFVELLPPARPQLLVLDGHFAHISLDTVKYGVENDVHIFVLPAHTSHFLQPLDVGVFQTFKSLYNKGVAMYPLSHNAALPVKDDVGEISKVPFEAAFSVKNIKRGFRDTGIFPLSLDTMLNKMVGNKPAPNTVTLHYHSMMIPHFDGHVIDTRTQATLKRRKLNLDTLNVVNLSLKMLLAPRPQPRPKGAFVDEKVSGAKLLGYAEMLQEQQAKAKAKRTKEAVKLSAKLARDAAKLSRPQEAKERTDMALHDKVPPKKSRKRPRQQCSASIMQPRPDEIQVEADVVQTWVF